MRQLLAMLILALCAANLSAQQTEGIFAYEPGMNGCGKYLQDRRVPNRATDFQYASWMLGFITGYNTWGNGKQISRALPADTLLAYIDKYCRENPLQSVMMGTAALINEFGGKSGL